MISSFTLEACREIVTSARFFSLPKEEWIQLSANVILLNTETNSLHRPYSLYFIKDDRYCYEFVDESEYSTILKIYLPRDNQLNERISFGKFFSILRANDVDITEHLFSENSYIRSGAREAMNEK